MSLILRYYPSHELKTKCTELPPEEFAKYQDITQDMLFLMSRSHGIGLAAPQVGLNRRVIVMRVNGRDYRLANPRIVSASEEFQIIEEGCLSLPGVAYNVRRPAKVVVSGYDFDAERVVEHTFTGLAASCAAHEIDHLEGTVFIDRIGAARQLVLQRYLKRVKKGLL